MIVQGIDPRDPEWEVEGPVYRVYFWHQPLAPKGVRQEHTMFHSDEYRLSAAVDSPGLIHLMGVDPTVPN